MLEDMDVQRKRVAYHHLPGYLLERHARTQCDNALNRGPQLSDKVAIGGGGVGLIDSVCRLQAALDAYESSSTHEHGAMSSTRGQTCNMLGTVSRRTRSAVRTVTCRAREDVYERPIRRSLSFLLSSFPLIHE